MLDVPVALFIFRRPETTRHVFARIRAARPTRLLVVADGPRPDRAGEAAQCAQARAVTEAVDWPCDVRRTYADANMGLQQRMASGLDWVFEQVDRAIILEDDCVPDSSFFPFCADVLDRYADDTQVMTVAGSNRQPVRRTPYSYYFSHHMHCWGWATWRRAWQHFDLQMTAWPELRRTQWLTYLFDDARAERYWLDLFDRLYAGEIDSWAYVWQLCIWMRHGLNVLPNGNLVSNIGFGAHATNTVNAQSEQATYPVEPVTFPLAHPPCITRHAPADRYRQHHHIQRPLHRRVQAKLQQMVSRLRS